MGSLISGVTDALGLTNVAGQQAAQDAANANAAGGLAMSKEQIAFEQQQLDFQKTQYGDWQNIYGNVEKNVGNYYQTLTPDKLETLGLTNQQNQFQQVQKATKQQFAQSGMGGSGLEQSVLASNILSNAESKTAIRTNAPQAVAQQQEQFIGLGLGQGTAELGTIAQASNTVNNAFSTGVNGQYGMAQSYLNQSTSMSNQNTQNMADIMGTISGTAAAHFMPAP